MTTEGTGAPPDPSSQLLDELGAVGELSDLDVLDARILAEEARRSGSKSLSAFVKQAWAIVDPAPLVWSWHLEAICLHLEAVARGQMTRLVINIGPRHGKSNVFAILWPAWVWTFWPKCQWLFLSYSATLSVEHSVKCRQVIESPWYQATFAKPGGWQLRGDQNVKHDFVNTAGGRRRATSITGMVTGAGGDLICVDDPINAEDAHSKAERETANRVISEMISTRLNDRTTGRVVLTMQSLHEEDPARMLLKSGAYQHLCLPSEFESERRAITYVTVKVPANGSAAHEEKREFWRDPRTTEGEPLDPDRFPKSALEELKVTLGAERYAGQHQQRPMPAGGGMFKTDWWRFWKPDGVSASEKCNRPGGCSKDPARALPDKFDQVVISVDANFKNKEDADRVSIQVIAEKGADRYLLYRVNGPFGFTKSVQAIRETRALYKRARAILIETAANGDAIIETLKGELSGVLGIRPEGGKEARAWAVQPQVQAGNCYLPDGAPWLDEFVSEFSVFPKGAHDDDVDAFTQALNYLSNGEETVAQKWARRFSRDARA